MSRVRPRSPFRGEVRAAELFEDGGTAVFGELLREFAATISLGSRKKGGDGVEARTAARIVGSAVFTSLLAAGAGIEPFIALDRLFTRVFKTKAASREQKDWVGLLVNALASDRGGPGQVQYIHGLSDYDPSPAFRLLHATRQLLAGTPGARAVADLQIAFGAALQLLGRHQQVRGAGEITCAAFENFADYFRTVARFVDACSHAMGLGVRLKMSYLAYEDLYAAARDPTPKYDLILLDDPWLAEYRAIHRGAAEEPVQFSAHVMVFCFHRRHRPLIEGVLGASRRVLNRADLMRVAKECCTMLIPEADVQKPYSIAQQVCRAGDAFLPRGAELRDAYRELRGAAVAPPSALSQGQVLELIGREEGKAFGAPIFLGHAVADSAYAGRFDFLPFAGGGVSGNWFVAAAGPRRERAAVLAEVFAAPLDETATISHGIVPAQHALTGTALRGPGAMLQLTQKLDASEDLLYGPHFPRFEGENSFIADAVEFNSAVCGR